MHSITDLEARYDAQPYDIGGIALDAVWVFTKLIKLTTNASKNFENFACTSRGISEESHGSKNE